jgi:hypothetical protein
MTPQERLEHIKNTTKIHTTPWNNGRRFDNEVIMKTYDFHFLIQLAETALKQEEDRRNER